MAPSLREHVQGRQLTMFRPGSLQRIIANRGPWERFSPIRPFTVLLAPQSSRE